MSFIEVSSKCWLHLVVDSLVNPDLSLRCLGHLAELSGTSSSGSLDAHLARHGGTLLVLEPPHLGGGPVALVVTGGDPEDDGGLGGGVYVGCGQAVKREMIIFHFLLK